ncbi:SAVED domain-containing protein [candidate division KSB1 bacterium]|nr:SAVED domain-containing protein [candidate division KSB1 bacterium]
MSLLPLAKDALTALQQADPGLSALVSAGTILNVAGKAAVAVVKKGAQLITYLITRREDEEQAPSAPLSITRPHVAILVDLNRRMLQDVARYLDEQNLDADMLVVTNDPAYSDKVKFLDPNQPEEWTELVQEFTATMNAIKHQLGGAQVHIFLSTPLPLAFGLGAVWGTVDLATVYHYQEIKKENRSTYYPAMKISRELRQ